MQKNLSASFFAFILGALPVRAAEEITINLSITPAPNPGSMAFFSSTSTIEHYFDSDLVDLPVTGLNSAIQSLYAEISDPEFEVPLHPLENEITTTLRSLSPEDVSGLQSVLSDIAGSAPSFFIRWSAFEFSLNGNNIAYDPENDPVNAGFTNLVRLGLMEVSSNQNNIPYSLHNSSVSSIPGRSVLVEVQTSCPNVDLSQVAIEDVVFEPSSGGPISARYVSGPVFADDNAGAEIRSCRIAFEILAFEAQGVLRFTWIDALQVIYYAARVNLGVIIGNPGTIIGNTQDRDDSPNFLNGNAAEGGAQFCGSSRKTQANTSHFIFGLLALILYLFRRKSV
jgi:hypothetical protein